MIEQIILVLIGFLLIQIPLYFLFPKLKMKHLSEDFWGLNSIFEAAVDPDAPMRAAVMAQEWSEAEWKILRLKGFPIIGQLFHLLPFMKRKLEIWGHECDVQAQVLLYNQEESKARKEEADLMKWFKGYHFHDEKDWTHEKIIRSMEKKRSKARKWVRKNEKELRKFMKKE